MTYLKLSERRSVVIDYINHRIRSGEGISAIAYTYFDYREPIWQNPAGVIKSLIKQLGSQSFDLPENPRAYYGVHPEQKNFKLLSSVFSAIAAEFDRVYICFDAFDECSVELQDKILSLVHQLSGPPNARVFLTSRPHVERLSRLPGSAWTLTIEASDTDVHRYLSSRLANERHLKDGIKNKIMDKLSKGAKGMYGLTKETANL
jgi:hypothetical protein